MPRLHISLRKEAYEFLKSRRARGESFSDIVLSFKEPKKNPMDFFGIWKDMPKEEFESIKKELEKTRTGFKKSFARRLK